MRRIEFARGLRRRATKAEDEVWKILRNQRLLGLKFRRQYTIDAYVADFYCHKHRPVLELDGSVHDNDIQSDHDETRSQYFRAKGLKVVRIRNEDVCRQTIIDAVEDVVGPGRLWPED